MVGAGRAFWTERARSLLTAALSLLILSGGGAAAPVGYATCNVGGVRLHVITVDLNDPRVVVSPALAQGGPGHQESFSSFVSRLEPVAAVNGTFFSKRSFRPVGDIVIAHELAHFGGMGTALAFANDGVDCIRLPKSRRVEWGEYFAALAGGPLLVWNGFPKPMPGGEGFGDPHVFAKAAPRTAAGITRRNKLLLVTTIKGTSLGKLAKAMQALGAVYAVNLDGGASCAMWCDGRTVKSAGRDLTNVLCVYVKPEPVRTRALRAPRGLDWRAGHKRPPSTGFRGADRRIWIELPRSWEGEQSVRISSDRPLQPGTKVRVCLTGTMLDEVTELPAAVSVNLAAHPRPKHALWIALVDAEGKVLGCFERILKGTDVPPGVETGLH